MAFDAALSTMWTFGRFDRLDEFFRAGSELGFTRFELNHGVDSAMLDGLALDGTIPAVHEPCPADVSMAALKERNWLISALDEECRRQGVIATRRSIDLASELGATAVVVHPGRVDVDPALEDALVALFKRGGRPGEDEYDAARDRLVAARAGQAGANLAAVRRSVAELADHAAGKGVRLGLENRLHYYEIPLPDEVDALLDGAGDAVGYWHDVGHAQVLEHLGFYTQEEWLRRFAPRIVGVHLHDVRGYHDHLAAGLGVVDWPLVARYLPHDALRTCEFHASNTPADVTAGVRRLVEIGAVRGTVAG